MVALAPDSRTAVVTLTHDPKLDDPALDVALKSDAFYIGALGSRRTHAKRVARLAELGHAEAAMAPHPRAGRAEHRGRHGARDRPVDPGRGRRRAARRRARCRSPRRPGRRGMIFGPTPLDEARGAVLAHTVRLQGRVLKKGTVLDQAAIAALQQGGHGSVIAARLEPGDVPEDEAADRLANALMGPLLARSRASTGRVNLLAETPGLLVVDAVMINRLNALDESLTVGDACLATARSAAKEMLATIKVIPFAVPGAVLQVAEAMARQGPPPLSLHPFRPLKVGLVLSELPGQKESVMEGAVEATRAPGRAALCGTLLPPMRARHETAPISDALNRLRRQGAQVLLIAGASAVVDRRDVGPAAIVRAGGTIDHFGMPVDPGNLICLGHIDSIPALVLPGCAKSPKLNGIDWVLQRLFAGRGGRRRATSWAWASAGC